MLPLGASSMRRVSCGLIHFGGRADSEPDVVDVTLRCNVRARRSIAVRFDIGADLAITKDGPWKRPVGDLAAALGTKPEQAVLLMNAAFSAPHERVNDGFLPRHLEPDPVGVRFEPIPKEMIDMMELAREDRLREVAVGFKLDDLFVVFFQNCARRISGEHRAGP